MPLALAAPACYTREPGKQTASGYIHCAANEVGMDKTKLIAGLLTAVCGIGILLHPGATEGIIVFVLGLGTVISGVYDLLYIHRMLADSVPRRIALIRSIVSIVVGAIAIFFPLQTADTMLTIYFFMMGIYLLLFAIAQLYIGTVVRKEGRSPRAFWAGAAASFIFASLLFLIPGRFGLILIKFVGILLLAYGIAMVAFAWKNRAIVVHPDSVRDDT